MYRRYRSILPKMTARLCQQQQQPKTAYLTPSLSHFSSPLHHHNTSSLNNASTPFLLQQKYNCYSTENMSSGSTATTLTRSTYPDLVLKAPESQRQLIKFEAEFCSTCKQLAPRLESITQQLNQLFGKPKDGGEKHEVKLLVADVEEEDAMAEAFGIQSLPTLYLMQRDQIKNNTIAGGKTSDKELKIFILKGFVEHEEDANQFSIDFGENGGKAVLKYQKDGDNQYTFYSVVAPKEVRGNSVGDALAEVAFEHAKEQNWKVTPTCSWITGKFLADDKVKARYASVLE